MLLVALFVNAWEIDGVGCPFCDGADAAPSSVHALYCTSQHIRGCHAVHTAMKHLTQALCKEHGVVSAVINEDKTPFLGSTKKLSMDTTLQPGALSCCADQKWQQWGFLLDNSVRSPTIGSRSQVRAAAATDGYAAEAGEKYKEETYLTHFSSSRWKLVPFVHETFGRMGRQGLVFIKKLAEHSARRRGGTVEQIKRRQSVLEAAIKVHLSARLAYEQAERLGAYVGEAVFEHRRRAIPVSTLLTPGGL
jgi:hypothetical protein